MDDESTDDYIRPSWKRDTEKKTHLRYPGLYRRMNKDGSLNTSTEPLLGIYGVTSKARFSEVLRQLQLNQTAAGKMPASKPVREKVRTPEPLPSKSTTQKTPPKGSVDFMEEIPCISTANFDIPLLTAEDEWNPGPKRKRRVEQPEKQPFVRPEECLSYIGSVSTIRIVVKEKRNHEWREPSISRAILSHQDLRDIYGSRLARKLIATGKVFRSGLQYDDLAALDQGVADSSTPVNGADHTRPPLPARLSSITETDSTPLARQDNESRLNIDGSIYEATSDTTLAISGGISWRHIIRKSVPRDSMLTRFSCEEAGRNSSSVSLQEQKTFLFSMDGLTVQHTFLEMCGQSMPHTFTTFFPKDVLDTCTKIGEGAFGEVFGMTKDGRPQAVKVIPIEGAIKYNECDQLKYRDILFETTVAKKLSDLRKGVTNRCVTFMEVYEIHCVVGLYPERMRREWHIYDRKWTSANDNPNSFQPDQKFAMLVGEHCGSTLEDFKGINPDQAWSVIWQLSLALAVAEVEVEFEHRDLHLGNIMVRPTSADKINFMLNGVIIDLPTNGIHVSIIDYSLSRMLVDGEVLYVNLAEDETLFEGEGLQYDVYRSMRIRNENNWKQYCGGTNVQWLIYVCRTLRDMLKTRKWSREERAIIRRLASLNAEIEISTSAMDFVITQYIPAMLENRKRNEEWAQRANRLCRRATDI